MQYTTYDSITELLEKADDDELVEVSGLVRGIIHYRDISHVSISGNSDRGYVALLKDEGGAILIYEKGSLLTDTIIKNRIILTSFNKQDLAVFIKGKYSTTRGISVESVYLLCEEEPVAEAESN
jgi:hypothetical protein